MNRPCAKFAHSVAALLLLGAPPATAKRVKPKPAKVLVKKPSAKLSLTLESVDRQESQAIVLVSGVKRSPESRLFTFRDDRDHKFIALDAKCAPAGAQIRCTLDLPRGYLVHPIRALSLTVRAREIAANPADVAAKFEPPGPALAPLPDGGVRTLDTPRRPPDAGN